MGQDWQQWSRDAVALMQERNRRWTARVPAGSPYRFAEGFTKLRLGEPAVLAADLVSIGTTSASLGTFRWAWVDSEPAPGSPLDQVREFGARNDLTMLVTPEFDAGRPQALEMLAVAGRITHADGVFIHPDGDCTFYLLLFGIRPIEP